MDKQMTLFKRLTEACGAPGFEGEVRAIIKEYISETTNEIVFDNLGSIFGVLRGDENGPKIMVAGHMDEVGFMVTRITDQGFIQFQPLGGWWSQVLLAQRVQIITNNGPIMGVISSIPPHVLPESRKNKPMDIKDMFIDIGADNKEDAEEIGVRPGQPILPVCPFTVMGNPKKMMAKAWDNRYGCALAVEMMQEMKDAKHPNIIYGGATVQEEVGLRGAGTAANMIEPDVFFALDASPAGDIPGLKEGMGKLGKGLLMRIMDRTMVTLPGLRDFMIDTAEELGIRYQFFVSPGGTDAGRVHLTGKGVPSAVIGIPARYIHSHAAIIHRDDYEAAKQLLLALLKRLDHAALKRIKERQ
ncbi:MULTISPECIES: M42 family metallopeptidase [Aneurinibacillus]|uniref:M42 family metallopeptidase n=2 Tax=Aneurinibacillus thermoaerophilus TaxID=143495 RepID=A0ABX8Y825_ANETH|nr:MULTISPECIES: M42 family metallopeptidase [Aneurinibacillus]AMA72445.1 peptidase M28 [Aneurinibacillus sp. XH2]MED0675675.1 M42 family metallopeptidase [Aneurinibacillus thermoaerophilus]MED0679921.1 M42 family metallopeptidase [Aneurinibacillus thermoaerophilus]MED0735576.1 M42 family metallopeptidase [Aneurinibacillus thermoaerophilus]MED0758773.1 M42 family metallopeptidase [Aneurinibacillus thermoaerophilus]